MSRNILSWKHYVRQSFGQASQTFASGKWYGLSRIAARQKIGHNWLQTTLFVTSLLLQIATNFSPPRHFSPRFLSIIIGETQWRAWCLIAPWVALIRNGSVQQRPLQLDLHANNISRARNYYKWFRIDQAGGPSFRFNGSNFTIKIIQEKKRKTYLEKRNHHKDTTREKKTRLTLPWRSDPQMTPMGVWDENWKLPEKRWYRPAWHWCVLSSRRMLKIWNDNPFNLRRRNATGRAGRTGRPGCCCITSRTD